MTTLPNLYTPAEVAVACGCSPRTVARDIRRGVLRVVPHGRGVRIPEDALASYRSHGAPTNPTEKTPGLTLRDRLAGLEPGTDAREFLEVVAGCFRRGIDIEHISTPNLPIIEKAIRVLLGTEPYSDDRIEVCGFHSDWGSYRLIIGAPAYSLAVLGNVQENQRSEQRPGTVLQYVGVVQDVCKPERFENMAILINGVIQHKGWIHVQLWESVNTRSLRLKQLMTGTSLPPSASALPRGGAHEERK